MKLNANQILNSTKGSFIVEPVDTSIFAVGARIDSRKIKCGDLFVAMNGEKSDGHLFIDKAIENGASVILVEKDIDNSICEIARNSRVCIIKVDDGLAALQNIAKDWRRFLTSTVIGITGSTGKTSTKKLCLDVLSAKFSVTANTGNYNNHIGVPMTICDAKEENDFLITEMGMNAAGEIATLCDFAKPDWGLITNCGEAHIEYLGSRENIAKAKAELAQNLPDRIGKMFLYADDDYMQFIRDYAKLDNRDIETILFGSACENKNFKGLQVWNESVEIDDSGCAMFDIFVKNKTDEAVSAKVHLKVPGRHNVINACAACAIGVVADMNLDDIVSALNTSSSEHGRQEILTTKDGVKIINDAYNANPQSMEASLITFKDMKIPGKKICFLGDMFELGDKAEETHKNIGLSVASKNFDYLICVGKMAKFIAESSEKSGLNKDIIYWSDNNTDALNHLLSIANAGDAILFKASNGMGFQNLVKEITS